MCTVFYDSATHGILWSLGKLKEMGPLYRESILNFSWCLEK